MIYQYYHISWDLRNTDIYTDVMAAVVARILLLPLALMVEFIIAVHIFLHVNPATWSRWKGCTSQHRSDIRPNKIYYLILIPTHTKLTVWVNIFVQQRSHKRWRRRKILLPGWATLLNRRQQIYCRQSNIITIYVCIYIWQVFFKTNRVRWLLLLWP